MGMRGISQDRLEKLIRDIKPSGGSEMSNYQLFVERLTGALDLPQPEFAREETRFNDYVFERNVTFRHPNGTSSTGRIDCYKRGCFILEAKQSAKRQHAVETEQLALAGLETTQKLGHAKRGTKSWDKVMIAARRQAEDYARALPVDHGYGWSDLGARLVGKPGGTVPSPHKSEDQEAAEEELLVRLVALNQQRAAEEKAGKVHWLRPAFQKPRLASKVKSETQIEANLGEAALIEDIKWPTDGLEQIRSVRDLLARATAPISVPALAAVFGGRNTLKRRQRVEQVLDTLISTGAIRRDEATNGYYLPR